MTIFFIRLNSFPYESSLPNNTMPDIIRNTGTENLHKKNEKTLTHQVFPPGT